MATGNSNVIFLELALDICYRLELFNALFCRSTAVVTSAVATEDCVTKAEAIQAIRVCAQALQLIYADLSQILAGRPIFFPADIADWIWEQPNADTIISEYLERLQSIAQVMEMLLSTEISALEMR